MSQPSWAFSSFMKQIRDADGHTKAHYHSFDSTDTKAKWRAEDDLIHRIKKGDLDGELVKAIPKQANAVRSCCFTSDSRRLVLALDSQNVVIWKVPSDTQIGRDAPADAEMTELWSSVNGGDGDASGLEEFLHADDAVATNEDLTDEAIVAAITGAEDDSSDDEEEPEPMQVVSHQEAL
ncbi:hypothetical protein HPB52_020965 [Rhipicephalus sanguineus]|uniref:Uncharacterized protein n=1 Tax=Rhipicephalus sanguineus TaxID=34632 RepID=A0A9D4Q7T5_RHISA|nr:hypothetical protein HPB52_020965 [Rhipicephalus sanguineus]